MSQPLFELQGISAGYGGAPVVRDVTISVNAGEVVGILGVNGAGKTTTLRVGSGLTKPMAGRAMLAGEDVTTWSPQARATKGVAHVIEGRGVFAGLTVEEHFRLGPRGARLDRQLAYELFPALGKLAGRPAGLLSGGEQQMLSLARAVVRKPRVMLIDELSLGLAPVIVARLLPIVRDFADNGGAVVLVEQHVPLALGVIDRGYILSHGKVVHSDSASGLRADGALVLSSYLGEV